jgi:hypothetical protein
VFTALRFKEEDKSNLYIVTTIMLSHSLGSSSDASGGNWSKNSDSLRYTFMERNIEQMCESLLQYINPIKIWLRRWSQHLAALTFANKHLRS